MREQSTALKYQFKIHLHKYKNTENVSATKNS